MGTITEDKLLEEIKGLVKELGSQVAAATELEISPQYMNDILLRRKPISDKVAQQMGYEKIVTFQKVEE